MQAVFLPSSLQCLPFGLLNLEFLTINTSLDRAGLEFLPFLPHGTLVPFSLPWLRLFCQFVFNLPAAGRARKNPAPSRTVCFSFPNGCPTLSSSLCRTGQSPGDLLSCRTPGSEHCMELADTSQGGKAAVRTGNVGGWHAPFCLPACPENLPPAEGSGGSQLPACPWGIGNPLA